MTSEQNYAPPERTRKLHSSVLTWCQTVTQSFSGAIFPPECQVCNVPLPSGDRVCLPCKAAIVSGGNCCQRCAMPLPDVLPSKDCIRCRGKKWAFSSVLALGPYQGQLSEIVVQLKKPSQEPLRQAIGGLLSERLLAYCENSTGKGVETDKAVLIPVPNHWSHSFGYAANTAGLLAAAMSEFSQIPLASRTVRRTRKTGKQGMLAWTDRTRNVAGAFKILRANHITGRHVFLVDDVLTSGATAAEIAKVLRRGGATQVDVVVAARGTGTKSL